MTNKTKYKTRFKDLPTEYRIRLRRTVKLPMGGEEFFHEDIDKQDQFLSATLFPNGTLDIVLHLDKLEDNLPTE